MMKTNKLYYQNPRQASCFATILAVSSKGIVTDQTVAFPEGGGQIGDRGILKTKTQTVPFYDTVKGLGKPLVLPDFPVIQIDTPVYHVVAEEFLHLFQEGETIEIQIDLPHRIGTTVHHTGIHLALMAAQQVNPDITKFIKGCKIQTDTARLDFASSKKFSPEEMTLVSQKVTELVQKNLPIKISKHNNFDDAWNWTCGDFSVPCGGMHLQETGQIQAFDVRRKTKGKATERLIISVTEHAWLPEFYQTKVQ